MSFFDELGLKAAEQLEASVGPFVALASYKRLYPGPPDIRQKATLGAIRCAVTLEDDREVELAIGAMGALEAPPEGAVAYAVELLSRGKPELAIHLAEVELAVRGGTARPKAGLAAYVKARALEVSLDQAIDACTLWGDVVTRAREAGDEAVVTRATSRFMNAWLTRARKDPTTTLPRATIAAYCEKARIDDALAEDKLLVLRGRLLSASNFQRASALSALEELARRGQDSISRKAIAITSRHFDSMPFHLHSIEIDRVRASLKRVPDGPAKVAALARLEATVAFIKATAERGEDRATKIDAALDGVARASDLARSALARLRAAEGGGEGAGGNVELSQVPFDRMAARATTALVAMHRDANAEAAQALGQVTDLVSPDSAVPIHAWSAASIALGSPTPALRAAATELVSAAMRRTTTMPPPPLVGLASRLVRAGAHAVAGLVLEEASRFKEPAARAASADTKRRLAYEALARSDRQRAWEELRAARDLFEGARG